MHPCRIQFVQELILQDFELRLEFRRPTLNLANAHANLHHGGFVNK